MKRLRERFAVGKLNIQAAKPTMQDAPFRVYANRTRDKNVLFVGREERPTITGHKII